MKNYFKSTVFAFLSILAFNSQLFAQTKVPTMSYVLEIEQSADKVWQQVRVMDNIDKLTKLVAKVDWTGPKGTGGSRVCTAPDGKSHYKETILTFNDAERTYTYKVEEGVPAKNMVNRFKVVDMGYNKSMIVWTSNFEFMENPQMTKDQFTGFLQMGIGEMLQNIALLSKN